MHPCLFCWFLVGILLVLLLWRFWSQPRLIQDAPAPPSRELAPWVETPPERLSSDTPVAFDPATGGEGVTKFVLLVCGSYPGRLAVVRRPDQSTGWVPASRLDREPDGTVSLFTEGDDASFVATAWRALIARYTAEQFRPEWGFAAIKPYSNADIDGTLASIAARFPNLTELVFQYLGHGDHDDAKRPFLSIRGRRTLRISQSGGQVAYPSDGEVADRYFTESLCRSLDTKFPNVTAITVVVDGCELFPTRDFASPPKLRVVVCDDRQRPCIEGAFSQYFGASARLTRTAYSDYATQMQPLLDEVNGKLKNLPPAAGSARHRAVKNP